MKKHFQLNSFSPRKENIADLFKSRVDLSGNIGKNAVLISKTLKMFNNRHFLRSENCTFLLLNCLKVLNIGMKNAGINYKNIRELIKENLNVDFNKLLIFVNKILALIKLRMLIKENKYISLTRAYTSIKLRRPFQKNVETGQIVYNHFFKSQLSGYPHLKSRYRVKLRKRLLISRLRDKYKFIIMNQSIALHSFQNISYSYLVKTNKVHTLSTLYQYRSRLKKKEKISTKDKIFLKRPFQSERTNRPRFHVIDHSSFNKFFNKMKEQMLSAFI